MYNAHKIGIFLQSLNNYCTILKHFKSEVHVEGALKLTRIGFNAMFTRFWAVIKFVWG